MSGELCPVLDWELPPCTTPGLRVAPGRGSLPARGAGTTPAPGSVPPPSSFQTVSADEEIRGRLSQHSVVLLNHDPLVRKDLQSARSLEDSGRSLFSSNQRP